MMTVFIVTGIISSIFMLIASIIFKPGATANIPMEKPDEIESLSLGEQLVNTFTVPDFINLFSGENMMALIVFSVLIGLATGLSGAKGKPFATFLNSGSEVLMKLVQLVMYYAPIGLGAYFASLIGEFGSDLIGDYAKAIIMYYPVALLYFVIAVTIYAFLAGGKLGITRFWTNILPPAVTSLGTGSSVASIPVNIQAAKNIGVPKDIRKTIIPLGATSHMHGSCLVAMLKIFFVFGVFDIDFTGMSTYTTVIGICLLSGIVMSGIPGGVFMGELMIITLY